MYKKKPPANITIPVVYIYYSINSKKHWSIHEKNIYKIDDNFSFTKINNILNDIQITRPHSV